MGHPAKLSTNYSGSIRERLFIVPSEKNSDVELLSVREEKLLVQTLTEIRTHAEKRRSIDQRTPVCFISFVHGKHDTYVEKIADYLEIAGFTVYADIGDRHEKLKLDRASYLQKAVLEKWDFVVVIGTPEYLEAYKKFVKK